MFRTAIKRITGCAADVIDEMLVGDFDLIEDQAGVYADVDYRRQHPRRLELHVPVERRPCNAPAPRPLTSAALRCRA